MKLSWRNGVALVISGLVLGGVVSAVAQDSAPEPSDEARVEDARHPGKGYGFHRGLVRSEAVVEREEGVFVTVRLDRGVLEAIDGDTLLIEEADGESVRVVTNEDTNFWKDGEEAEIGDLEQGDHVRTLREKRENGDFVTRRVIAISAERYAELEQRRGERLERREACRTDPEQCPPRMRLRMRGRPGLDEGDVERAGEPATDETIAV